MEVWVGLSQPMRCSTLTRHMPVLRRERCLLRIVDAPQVYTELNSLEQRFRQHKGCCCDITKRNPGKPSRSSMTVFYLSFFFSGLSCLLYSVTRLSTGDCHRAGGQTEGGGRGWHSGGAKRSCCNSSMGTRENPHGECPILSWRQTASDINLRMSAVSVSVTLIVSFLL